MNNFLNKILVFIILLVIFLAFWNWRVDVNIYDHEERKYEHLYSEIKSNNSIIMGTSHLLNSLNPKYLNTKSNSYYNYSFPGAGPKFFYDWFTKIYLPNNKVPKTIIYELHWLLFDKKKLYRRLEHDSEFLNYSDFFLLLAENDFDAKLALKNRFQLIKYNDFSNFKTLFVPKTNYTPFPIELINDGFVPCELSEEHKSKNFGEGKLIYKSDSLEQVYFEKLISLFTENKINIIFVSAPEYGANPNTYKNLEIYDYFNSFSSSHNIPFYNYNIDLYSGEYDSRDLFSDWDHTNSKGADKFSRQFALDLQLLSLKK